MQTRVVRLFFGLCLGTVAGCATGSKSVDAVRTSTDSVQKPLVQLSQSQSPSGIVPAQHTTTGQVSDKVQVDEFVARALERNPRLAKAQHLIEAAQGRTLQAGLYPNPTLDIAGDELGDRTGPGGIWTAPKFSQEIVTGGKLTLAQAVAAREVDIATLTLLRERYELAGAVRSAFYDVYALEQRVAVLDELVKLATDGVKFGQALLENKQIARLDYLQLEVERERLFAKAEAARREIPWARQRLAAIVGDSQPVPARIEGPFVEVPVYDPDRILSSVLAAHPDLRSARVNVERARAAVRNAEAAVVPNVTLATGYTRQNQNQSSDWLVGVSLPIPTWNRNQGAIRAAQAEQCAALQEVARVENELTERTAASLRKYQAAIREADLYKRELLPRSEETYRLSVEAFRGGQFEYLRVIQAQRAIAEARLEYIRALGEAWNAAAELSALLLEDHWPGPPPGQSSGQSMGRVKVESPTTLTEVDKK